MIATATAPAEAQTITEGWHEDLSLEDYLAIPAMSASGLLEFRRSPTHYRWAQQNPKEATPAMKEGSALHLALLEPHLFEGRYVALGQCEGKKGDGDRCTYQGSVYRAGSSFCKTHDPQKGEPQDPAIHVMAAEALERIEGMRKAVLAHPDAAQFFRGKGRSEVTGVWRDEASGVLCKIRLDRDIDRAFIHADVKTCPDASDEAFTKHAGRMGYVTKAAWYRRGMAALGREATASVLIAVEQKPPHGCQTFLLDEGDLAALAADFDRTLASYAECLERDEWPSYPGGLRALKLKPWDLPDAAPADYDDTDDDLEEY